MATPDTLLVWYQKLIASRFDGSKLRKSSGRPRTDEEIEHLVVRMAKENPGWGYDRIVGAMANLGYRLSDQTVGNIPDFFMVEVLTMKGLLTYYVLFFIHLESRKDLSGRDNAPSGSGLDGTDGAQYNDGRERISIQPQISSA